MTDTEIHLNLFREKREAAIEELKRKRYSVVADLTIKAVEQAIEAVASQEDIHFHTEPRTAHKERIGWLKHHFPQLASKIDFLWGVYGALGYGGGNGERAQGAVQAMEEIIRVLEERNKAVFG